MMKERPYISSDGRGHEKSRRGFLDSSPVAGTNLCLLADQAVSFSVEPFGDFAAFFLFCEVVETTDDILVPALSGHPELRHQLWRANQRLRFHHVVGNKCFRRDRSLNDLARAHLARYQHQHHLRERRLVVVHRSRLDELPQPLLPCSAVVKTGGNAPTLSRTNRASGPLRPHPLPPAS